jgi:hypothetical protein
MDRQRALQERPRPRKVALFLKQEGEVVEVRRRGGNLSDVLDACLPTPAIRMHRLVRLVAAARLDAALRGRGFQPMPRRSKKRLSEGN